MILEVVYVAYAYRSFFLPPELYLQAPDALVITGLADVRRVCGGPTAARRGLVAAIGWRGASLSPSGYLLHPGDAHFSQEHCHSPILHPIALQWSQVNERDII